MAIRRLNLQEKEKIFLLRKSGLTFRKIASTIGCSVSTTKDVFDKYESLNTSELIGEKKNQRKRLLTKKDDRYIMICSKRNRKLTLPILTSEFNLARTRTVSFSTIRRSLFRNNMRGRIGAKKPLLRKANIQKRLKFAKEHVNWTTEQWNNVLFTDESKFEMFGCKRRVFVRRMPNERFIKECLVPTVKHGGGSVMVWGGICAKGVVPLLRIRGIMKKEQYHSILCRHAVPNGKKLLSRGFIFQQDNDPKHKALLNVKYLQNKEKTGK